MAKILFLSHHFPLADEAGTGRPYETALFLTELGHNVVILTANMHYMTGGQVVTSRLFYTEQSVGPLRIIRIKTPLNYRSSMVRRLYNFGVFACLALFRALTLPADVVFSAMDPVMLTPVAWLLSMVKGARLIVDERDVWPESAMVLGFLRSRVLICLIDVCQTLVRRRAASIIAATPGIKRILVADKGVPADKVTVLVNAFLDDPSPMPDDLLSKPVREGGPFNVLYAGSMGPANELAVAVRAAALLQEKFGPQAFSFLFIGEGDQKVPLEQFCAKQHIFNCHFLGTRPRKSMRQILDTVDVCISSHRDSEFLRCVLPTKVFNYLANGKPVVYAGRGDVADLLEAAQAGVTVEPMNEVALADAILQLSRQPEVRKRMGRDGKRYVMTHFNRTQLRERIAEALEPCLA